MTPATNVLTIAGSDSSGGAGIQADLKTIAAHGLHGLSVITAVTAQNNRRLEAIHRVPVRHITAQLRAVFDGHRVGAIKVGMLGGAPAIAAIVAALRRRRSIAVVVDPVLVSSSGSPLLSAAGLRCARRDLFPLATLLTPNVPEAEALLGRRIRRRADLAAAARDLLDCGAGAVLLKGGHLRGPEVHDVLATATATHDFVHARLPFAVRGTGCTLATAIACGLAQELPLDEAVARAERFLQEAMRRSRRTGAGPRRVSGLMDLLDGC